MLMLYFFFNLYKHVEHATGALLWHCLMQSNTSAQG